MVGVPVDASASLTKAGAVADRFKTFTLTTDYFATLPDQVEDIKIYIDEEETTENFSYASPVVTFETAPADNSIVQIVNNKLNKPQKSIKTTMEIQMGIKLKTIQISKLICIYKCND